MSSSLLICDEFEKNVPGFKTSVTMMSLGPQWLLVANKISEIVFFSWNIQKKITEIYLK